MTNDPEHDLDVQDAVRQVTLASRRLELDPRHKLRLREELLRRHQELAAESTQRAAGTLRSLFTGPKRLTLVAPPALVALSILSFVLWGLNMTGQETAQTAEAARLTQALVQTIPTVSGWRVTVHQQSANSAQSYQCVVPLRRGQRLLVRDNVAYLYSSGAWYRVTPFVSATRCSAQWQWAFLVLPSRLAERHFRLLPPKIIGGRPAVGIHYMVTKTGSTVEEATAWVDRRTGLTVRLETVMSRNGHVQERDFGDYRYERARS